MLVLRQAQQEDCRLLWQWANDPVVRSSSFSTARISWEEHVAWFDRRLRDPNCTIFIALNSDRTPVGQVRIEFNDTGEGEIDISVDQAQRGNGYGPLILEQAATTVFEEGKGQVLHAYIKPDNEQSIKTFEQVGFQRQGHIVIRGSAALHYVRVKEHG